MQKVNIMAHVRFALSNRLFVITAIATICGWAILLGMLVLPGGLMAATQQYCDNSTIITCGVASAQDFVNKYNNNATGDLKAIYDAYGLQSSELDRFQKTAKAGTLKNDGTLTVDSKVIGHNATTIGRMANKDGHSAGTATIGGKTYYKAAVKDALNTYGDSSTPALVMMDSNNKPEFILMTGCGNPVTIEQPTYKCEALNAKKGTSANTYDFTTTVKQSGATFTKVVYDFGDSSATVEKTSPSAVVSHTYTKAGTYKAKVTAYFTYNGQTFTSSCETSIEIPEEKPQVSYECSSLTPQLIANTKYQYELTAQATMKGDVSLIDASFQYSDGGVDNNVVKTSSDQVAIKHLFSDASGATYNVKVTKMRFKVNSNETVEIDGGSKCQATITTPSTTNPTYGCTGMSFALKSSDSTKATYHYQLTAQASTSTGATLTGGSFKFDDGTTVTGRVENQSVVGERDLPQKTQEYVVEATLDFDVKDSQGATSKKSATCKDTLKVNAGTGMAGGTPTKIASTGPADMIGGAVGISGGVAAGGYYLRSRKDLIASALKRR